MIRSILDQLITDIMEATIQPSKIVEAILEQVVDRVIQVDNNYGDLLGGSGSFEPDVSAFGDSAAAPEKMAPFELGYLIGHDDDQLSEEFWNDIEVPSNGKVRQRSLFCSCSPPAAEYGLALH